MCKSNFIREDRSIAGKTTGVDYYNACLVRVQNAEECCSICQGNSQCKGYTYERADCSGFGGPTNTGVCFQLIDAVVAFGEAGVVGGSLNPFAQ